jgi:hypothetical protein
VGQPFLRGTHHAQRQVEPSEFILEFLRGVLFDGGLDRVGGVRALQMSSQPIEQVRKKPDHLHITPVLRAVGPVVGAHRPGVEHDRITVEELGL